MSRLYNTLEKIRATTQGGAAPHPVGRISPPRPRQASPVLLAAIGCLVICSGAAIGLYLSKHEIMGGATQPVSTPQQTAPLPSPQPTTAIAAQQPPPQNKEEQYARLNETGLSLLRDGQHWRSVHSFDAARQLAPDRPEPLINMAVALAELGLRVPAQRLFAEARTKSPDHPQLHHNVELLVKAGFLEDHTVVDTPEEPLPNLDRPR